jgi:polyhydroxyalkanoate synthase
VPQTNGVTPEDLPYGLGLAAVDPASLGNALGTAALELAKRPGRVLRGLGELAAAEASVAFDVTRMLLGSPDPPVAAPPSSDRRFADRAWKENPLLRGALGTYVVSSRWARKMLDAAELPPPAHRKASFALDVALDAAAPSSLPWLNPSVVKEALDTGGLSAWRGLATFADDVINNRGRPRQFERGAFQVGKTLAATPGRVVFRNHLMELIAYEPQTETVFEQPIVYSPAWINKYYVLDLAPGRSLIEHAVRAGFTVFAISYRNPDPSMSQLLLDDYLRDGLLTALDQAVTITGSPVANILSVCVGGTLAMLGLGVLAARGRGERVGWATLTVSLTDYSEPGAIGAFADERTIRRIERRNRRRGYHSATDLSTPFTLMRSNELVWNYVVSNWYMGRKPAPFDILAWNADATRLPAAMHSQFLRRCYLENRLVTPGAFEIDGTPVDLSQVQTPLYVVGAERDHIALWRGVYRTTQLVGGPTRFVLTSGGHIAGMVNPPGKSSARHYVEDSSPYPPDPDVWLAGASRVDGSWWEDWVAWAAERSGARVAPPRLPDGEPAPGAYVRG